LPIDPAAFATSNNRGTIVDSGTTLAYLVEEAYDPFVSSVSLLIFLCFFFQNLFKSEYSYTDKMANKIEA